MDSSGFEHHATVNGDPMWGEGVCGGALRYDGTDDWVMVPTALSALDGTAVTMEAWIHVTPYPWLNHYPRILGGGSENNYRLSLSAGGNNDQGRILWRLEIDGQIQSVWYAPTTFPALAWVHLAGTYDGATMRLYVNGELVGATEAPSVINAAGDMQIGTWDHIDTTYFDGNIDEVRIWNVARSAEEICADGGGTPGADGCVY